MLAPTALDTWLAPRVLRSPLAHAAVLGLLHALVDASTVTAVFRATRLLDMSRLTAFWLVLSYDLVAFGLQPLVGWISDRTRLPRALLLLGLVMSMLALATHSSEPFATMVFAGIGNAMFHVGAGVLVLEHGLEKTAPAGVFVGPGALGLGFGLWYGRDPSAGPIWPLALLLVVASVLTWALPLIARDGQSNPQTGQLDPTKTPVGSVSTPGMRSPRAPGDVASRLLLFAVVLLLVSVSVRALVGGAATRGCPKTLLLVLGAPIAACMGKMLGGFIADRIGWIQSTSLALIVAAPLIVFGAGLTPLLLVGVLLFQTTMPVTLIAVARALPQARGVAFGLPCLALVLGSLPGMFHGTEGLLRRPLLLVWGVLALVSVVTGLWLLGRLGRHGLGGGAPNRLSDSYRVAPSPLLTSARPPAAPVEPI